MWTTGLARQGKGLTVALALSLVPAVALAEDRRDDAPDARCEALLSEAVAQLAAEQYPTMLRIAEDRMLLCADPVSAFLLGLAQANVVDTRALSDPAQLEQMRLHALRNLRVAAAGATALPTRWQYTAHEWIVHLQGLGGPEPWPLRGGPSGDPSSDPSSDFDAEQEVADDYAIEPLDIPPAPPPQAQPVFPWGPVLTGTLGLASLTTGILLGISADDKGEEARRAARQLLELADAGVVDREQLTQWARQSQSLHDEASSDRVWANGLMIGGAAALVVAGVWYWLMPPEGKWRWAATPAGLNTRVRF